MKKRKVKTCFIDVVVKCPYCDELGEQKDVNMMNKTVRTCPKCDKEIEVDFSSLLLKALKKTY